MLKTRARVVKDVKDAHWSHMAIRRAVQEGYLSLKFLITVERCTIIHSSACISQLLYNQGVTIT